MVRNICLWVGKHLVALLVIATILAYGIAARDYITGWIDKQHLESVTVPDQIRDAQKAKAALETAAREVERYSTERVEAFEEQRARLASMGQSQLSQRRAANLASISAAQGNLLTNTQMLVAIGLGQSDKVSRHYQAAIDIKLLQLETDSLDGFEKFSKSKVEQKSLISQRKAAAFAQNKAADQWRIATAKARQLNDVNFATGRNFACKASPLDVGCERYRRWIAETGRAKKALYENQQAKKEVARIDRLLGSLKFAEGKVADTKTAAGNVEREIQTLVSEQTKKLTKLRKQATDNWLLYIDRVVEKPIKFLPAAAAILFSAIMLPVIIKAILYYLVAPFASRQPAIRLTPTDTGRVSIGSTASAVTKRVALDANQELLVLPEFLQSSPHAAKVSMKLLLSWRMPLSSLASGLVGLTRVRSSSPDYASVSATRDPLAEIALVTIDEASAMVIQPRALVGLVQPTARKVRISRYWRLNQLSAWLTFQFRYIVFHGPCTLIVQGTRGIVLEKAGDGRGINQAATIGFSAGLDYKTRRSEPFGAYLLGKQELFFDSFAGNEGSFLYEEMPREGQRTGIWGRGLSGLSDAALKVFGI